MWVLIFQRLTIEFFFDLVYFPVWWYTVGLMRHAKSCWGMFQSGNEQMAPGLWLRNLFVPMFGQYDWQGRIVSFFIRLLNVFGRTIGLCIWGVVVCAFNRKLVRFLNCFLCFGCKMA
jgi:hypothetical protein